MSRLYRTSRAEALLDVVATPERAAEIWRLERLKGYVPDKDGYPRSSYTSSFNTFSVRDERSSVGKWFRFNGSTKNLPKNGGFFWVFNGQGVYSENWGTGVIQEEDDNGREVSVLFFDEVVKVSRQSLKRIRYPEPERGEMITIDEASLHGCPKCSKVKLQVTVDADGITKHLCTGRACSYVAFWKPQPTVTAIATKKESVAISQAA